MAGVRLRGQGVLYDRTLVPTDSARPRNDQLVRKFPAHNRKGTHAHYTYKETRASRLFREFLIRNSACGPFRSIVAQQVALSQVIEFGLDSGH
jgi:hypothetical protein